MIPRILRPTLVVWLPVAAWLLAGCDGSKSKSATGVQPGGKAQLVRLEFGRLVDIYAYRRVDSTRPDRRDVTNRTPVLVARNVLINPTIDTQPLFDAVGGERTDAKYRFMPFDVSVGHEELLVLWDDQSPAEQAQFQSAVNAATLGLTEVAPSFRGQDKSVKPIPVIPRNAALKLTFDRDLGLSDSFFAANPSAVQLMEFLADPSSTPATRAFRPLPRRVIVQGKTLIVDTTLLGSEANNGVTASGLPLSSDQETANIRLALPTSGIVARQLNIESDPVTSLNGVDGNGDVALIRDFRSGNLADGTVGALSDVELPAVVADVAMGIVGVDTANRVLTINKRYSQVAVRGRLPFIDGGVDSTTGFPGGPSRLPTQASLRSGDIVIQDVRTPGGEIVKVRAEILQNLDVGTVSGDQNYPALGLAADGTDGGGASVVRVKVAGLQSTDSLGNPVSFQASTLPLGADCVTRIHYYHNVPYTASSAVVSDANRIAEFLVFDPAPPLLDANRNPIPRGTQIDPMAAVALRFSEPMDLATVQPYDNFLISNDNYRTTAQVTVAQLLGEAKPTKLSVQAVRLVDQQRDGTLLRLQPPIGLYHEATKTERYWFHMLLGQGGPRDLAGNPVDVYDRRLSVETALSLGYTMDPAAAENLVGSYVFRFAAADEDGTPPGSVDCYGQFQILDGQLLGAQTTRTSQVADLQNLGAILRYEKGECWFDDPNGMPQNPRTVVPASGGTLYQCPSMIAVQPALPQVFLNSSNTFGGIVEPHNPRGSRLQMTYREDDFSLGYKDSLSMALDLEQLHWAPWNNDPIQFDVFDRVSIDAAHADWRPDLLYFLNVPPPPGGVSCDLDCASLFSGLTSTFANNALQGTQPVSLVKDKIYQVDPNAAFRGSTGVLFVPYAKFERSYTWRDSRLVTWDQSADAAVGLGGAKQPDGAFPARDRTANVSSPWVPDAPAALFTGTQWTMDAADFRGEQVRDHDPIAMPLMLDFRVFPDDASNGFARGANLFHIAYVGPCWTPISAGGYYNAVGEPACAGVDYPWFRVHTSGGVDGFNIEQFVDPANTYTARGGWILDKGLGNPITARYQTKPGDDHLHWAQADFVRRTSLATFGFFDTQLPAQHNLDSTNHPTQWPGLSDKRGFPDFSALGTTRGVSYGATDFIAVVDPPASALPPGTSVTLEVRGAATFDRASGAAASTYIYDKVANDAYSVRGNLLNPSYSCEAFRYAMPNAGSTKDLPRVTASGLTPYVDPQAIDSIRDSKGQLPRFLNIRLVFGNNTGVTPAISPGVRSVALVYRMVAG